MWHEPKISNRSSKQFADICLMAAAAIASATKQPECEWWPKKNGQHIDRTCCDTNWRQNAQRIELISLNPASQRCPLYVLLDSWWVWANLSCIESSSTLSNVKLVCNVIWHSEFVAQMNGLFSHSFFYTLCCFKAVNVWKCKCSSLQLTQIIPYAN